MLKIYNILKSINILTISIIKKTFISTKDLLKKIYIARNNYYY